MQNLTATIPHQLGRSEAKRRIAEQVQRLGGQQGVPLSDLHTSWTEDTMNFTVKALGQSISGYLVIDDSAVHLTVALPWMMSVLAGTIKDKLEHGMRDALRITATPS